MAVVRRLAAEGARRPGTQQCTLLLLSQPDRPMFQKRDVNNAFVVELENAFERLECKHQALDLVAGVDAAAKLMAQDAATVRHLHIVSDFRAKDWRDRPALRAAFLAAAKTGASIDLARTVGESHDNLAITDLGGEVRTAAVGVPLRLSATIHNFGSKVAQNVRLGVLADGTLLPRTRRDREARSGQGAQARYRRDVQKAREAHDRGQASRGLASGRQPAILPPSKSTSPTRS